jgi:hypothetical protein
LVGGRGAVVPVVVEVSGMWLAPSVEVPPGLVPALVLALVSGVLVVDGRGVAGVVVPVPVPVCGMVLGLVVPVPTPVPVVPGLVRAAPIPVPDGLVPAPVIPVPTPLVRPAPYAEPL